MFWVMVGCHQVTLLHNATHVVAFVEIRCLLRRSILIERTCHATLLIPSLVGMHRVTVDSGSLFLLYECRRVLSLLETYRIVLSAPEVDAGYMLWVKVLRVGPDNSVQVCVHCLLRCAGPLRSIASLRAHDTINVGAATRNTSCRVA